MTKILASTGFKLISFAALILFVSILFFAHGSYYESASIPAEALNVKADIETRMCVPANLPVDIRIDLLNDPQQSGDVAFFEIELIARIEHDAIRAYFELPDGASRMSGDEEWDGVLELNELKKLAAGIKFDTEEDVSFRAVVEITRGDTTFQVGKSFNIDLGEKEHASLDQLVLSGLAGADTLNLIIPAGN